MLLQSLVHTAEIAQSNSFSLPVADFTSDLHRLFAILQRLWVLSQSLVHTAEITQGIPFPSLIADLTMER